MASVKKLGVSACGRREDSHEGHEGQKHALWPRSTFSPISPFAVAPPPSFRLTSDLELVNGREAISTMKVLSLVVSSIGLATALFGADSAGPVITLLKRTSLAVHVKHNDGATGFSATTTF